MMKDSKCCTTAAPRDSNCCCPLQYAGVHPNTAHLFTSAWRPQDQCALCLCRNHIVKESTGCEDVELANDVYDYFARPEAWTVTPGAVPALLEMKAAGEGGGMPVTWLPHRLAAEAVDLSRLLIMPAPCCRCPDGGRLQL